MATPESDLPNATTRLKIAFSQVNISEIKKIFANNGIQLLQLKELDFYLVSSCKNDQFELAKLLLDSMVNIDTSTFSLSENALLYACENGHANIVELLLTHPNSCDSAWLWRFPSSYITELVANKEISDLLERFPPAKVIKTDTALIPAKVKIPPQVELSIAIAQNNVEKLKKILSENDIEQFDLVTLDSTLYYCCKNGHVAMSKYLLDKLSVTDIEAFRLLDMPLPSACKAGHTEIVELLLTHPNTLNAPRLFNFVVPLDEEEYRNKGFMKIADLLHQHGNDPNRSNNTSYQLLSKLKDRENELLNRIDQFKINNNRLTTFLHQHRNDPNRSHNTRYQSVSKPKDTQNELQNSIDQLGTSSNPSSNYYSSNHYSQSGLFANSSRYQKHTRPPSNSKLINGASNVAAYGIISIIFGIAAIALELPILGALLIVGGAMLITVAMLCICAAKNEKTTQPSLDSRITL